MGYKQYMEKMDNLECSLSPNYEQHSLIGVNAQAPSGNQTEKPMNSAIPPIKEQEVGEIVEGRTENSKVFYNGDGTYTKNI